MSGLFAKRLRVVYDYLCWHTRTYALPPSVDEISAGVFYSRAACQRALEVLRTQGLILWADGRQRTIVVIKRDDGYPVPDVDTWLARYGDIRYTDEDTERGGLLG